MGPLTLLLSHHPHPNPRSQSRGELHQIRGHLCARCHPQRDKDNQPLVRCRLVFAFMPAPIDTPHHQPHSSARSLRSNGLGPKGGVALAEGLKGNSTLQSLE